MLPVCLNFKQVHGDFLGEGLIRQNVEDFKVKEVLGFNPSGEGEHAYLWIRKTGQNTGWVAEQLAKRLALRHFDIGFGGMKDRHAVTEQWFSCWLPGKIDPDWSSFDIEGVEILSSVRHSKKLRRGEHKSNQFNLVVRNVVLHKNNIGEVEARLENIEKQGFPNYFGPQRFGWEGRNLERANALFLGEKQDRKKRGIYISAARSYMFNRELSCIIGEGKWQDSGEGWLYGLAPHRDIDAPPLEASFQTWGEGLINLGVKAMKRQRVVIPENLKWNVMDGEIELSFTLPVGAYATSLLHELIDCEGKRK
ncbi:MAG: tRNA pseudouridine(13) synthase TruD [Pseudomonadales bacterium]|nr:tRNA pseudouridine(13) synthase TruD [Pseudomonadales bacterium]